MSNSKNAKLGSTRKKMIDEERQWLRDFNDFWGRGSSDSLAKIAPNEEIVTKLKQENNTRRNEMRRDIYHNMAPTHVDDRWEGSYDEGLEALIYGDGDNTGYEAPRFPGDADERKRDKKAEKHRKEWERHHNPAYPKRAANERYTVADYCKPSIPADEDALIDLIDEDRRREDATKIRQFPKPTTKLRKKLKEGA